MEGLSNADGGRRNLIAARSKPTLIAYVVKDPVSAEQKTIWTRIGAAWAHENGRGYSVRLDALPIDGR